MDTKTTVFVVDDDESVGLAVERLLRASGYATKRWNSARAFLCDHDPQIPGCLVTDLMMPEMSGLELHRILMGESIPRQVVMLTGSNVLTRLLGDGVSILRKPVNREDLLQAVHAALTKDAALRRTHSQ